MRTPARTLRAILKLTCETPIADLWPPPLHSPSHRAHWFGWLQEYDGSGYYNRRVPKSPRSMAFIYTHIHCAPMLLWLRGFGRQRLRAFGRYVLAKRKALPSSSWPLAPLIVNELQTSFPQGEDQQPKLTSMRKTDCTAEK